MISLTNFVCLMSNYRLGTIQFICLLVLLFVGDSSRSSLSGCLATSQERRVTYEGYKLVRIRPGTLHDVNSLQLLEDQSDGLFDIWSFRVGHDRRQIEASVAPSVWPRLVTMVNGSKSSLDIVNENLASLIFKSQQQNQLHRLVKRSAPSSFYNKRVPKYKKLEEIYQDLDQFDRHHSLVTVEILGYSEEKRPIKGVRISKDNKKPFVFVEAGIHAREWISHAAAMELIDKLVRFKSKLLDSYQFYIIPVLNPDGYVFSHNMHDAARRAQEAVLNRFGLLYETGSSADILYTTSGSTTDYVAANFAINGTVAIELSDRGAYGFFLPPSYIRPVGWHLWTMVNAFLNTSS